MSDKPIPLAGVADRLGRSVAWIYKNIRTLRDRHGFPRPLPGVGLYDPLAIDDWIRRQRAPAAAANDQPAPDDWAAILDARAANLVSKGIRT